MQGKKFGAATRSARGESLNGAAVRMRRARARQRFARLQAGLAEWAAGRRPEPPRFAGPPTPLVQALFEAHGLEAWRFCTAWRRHAPLDPPGGEDTRQGGLSDGKR